MAKRSRYYQGSIDLDMISKGEDYNRLKKSFVIFICTFDPFGEGRHMYSFENRCNEDHELVLQDEAVKVFLNTRGNRNDVDEEMIEFLRYIEDSTDQVANESKGDLVKRVHEKVSSVKADRRMEVEYMTLLERDRIKHEEGREEKQREIARALLDILEDEIIATKTGLDIEEVKAMRKNEE